MRKLSNRSIFSLAILGAAVVITAFGAYSAVDNTLTPQDREYISRYLLAGNVRELPDARSYDEELAFIKAVQAAVLKHAKNQEGIPFDSPREPKDLYKAKGGLCYDRSRTIEKILRYANFETRHVAVYSTETTGFAVISLLTPQVLSHAVTEALTQKGWVVIDSNQPWISYDRKGNPIDMSRIQSDTDVHALEWESSTTQYMNEIFLKPFTFVYGLYSRHGRFFPPYNRVPDINYGELVANLPGARAIYASR